MPGRGERASQWLQLRGQVRRGHGRWRWALHSTAQVVAIEGPSGAGKSTLLRLLAGLQRLSSGRLEVLGRAWDVPEAGRFVPAWERGVGWLPQDPSLFPHLSAERNLRFAQRLPAEAARAVVDWLEVGALLSRPAERLSGGERQRIALGRALLRAPHLLLLDEPFAAQDPARRARLLGALGAHLRGHGLHAVLVVHDPRDAEALGAERWRMREDGSLHRVGSAQSTPSAPASSAPARPKGSGSG